MAGRRDFAAVVDQESVTLVEYHSEASGYRVVGEWRDTGHSATIEEAAGRLRGLLAATRARRATLAVAIQHFGSFHHIMTLPGSNAAVIEPIIRREVAREFGVADPIVSFVSGMPTERRGPERADEGTAPRPYYIAGAPRTVIESLAAALRMPGLEVQGITVVPGAIRRVYTSMARSDEPTAVLVALASGPHLAFFLRGQLAFSVEPPIALAGERSTDPEAMVAQLERGTVYFRQQFGGAQPAHLLIAAPAGTFDSLAATLEEHTGIRVRPLMPSVESPEAIVAMGAVLAATTEPRTDLYPHPPTMSARMRAALRGPEGVATVAAAIGGIAAIWAGLQFVQVRRADHEAQELRLRIQRAMPQIDPLRAVAVRRAQFAQALSVATSLRDERRGLAASLAALGAAAPAALRFDTLDVTRTKDGWSVAIAGSAVTGSAAESVRAVDGFYQSLRGITGVGAPTLDRFDYPAAAGDTTAASDGDGRMRIVFRISFPLAVAVAGGPG